MKQNKVSFQNPKTGEPLSQQEIDEMFMRKNHRRGLSCKMWRGPC